MKAVSVLIVRDDGYAATVGIQPQDIIYRVNGTKLDEPQAVTDALNAGMARFELIRGGRLVALDVQAASLGVVLGQVDFDEAQWLGELAISAIPISTAPNLPGWHIEELLGMVGSECVLGVGVLADIAAGLRDMVGGRSKALETRLAQARTEVCQALREAAYTLGANALVSVSIQHLEIGDKGGFMLMVTATGTAVIARRGCL